MNEGYALRHLRKIMNWSFEVDNRETIWLRMMSDFKYDSYRDFWAGSRFVEALLDWLQQFDPADRAVAYDFIRNHLIFISFTEMQHLANRALPVHARQLIASRVAEKSSVSKYLVWSQPSTRKLYQDILNRTLFIGLSDGARIDGFRRANAGIIANDQVALGYEISDEKWQDLQETLRERTKDSNATFDVVFLIDDFVGSGKTLLRQKDGKWKGKLTKLAQSYSCHRGMFSADCLVAVHHYIGTETAKETIISLLEAARLQTGPEPWFPNPIFTSFDLLIKRDAVITRGLLPELDSLVDRYYDPAIETKSVKEGGTDAKFGFAACGLPLILEHNTPNNSLGLLWAESPIKESPPAHVMRPLFRRRQRHT
jgi:hypothetical protein